MTNILLLLLLAVIVLDIAILVIAVFIAWSILLYSKLILGITELCGIDLDKEKLKG